MRTRLLIGALAFGLVMTDPAICAQIAQTPGPDGSQPMPGETEDPANPMPDPSNPTPPMTEPLPPEMPMPAGEAHQMPPAAPMPAPVMQNRDMPMGPMATPPSAGQDTAVSGGTTSTMLTPVRSTKTYPKCTRTVTDNCTNPGGK